MSISTLPLIAAPQQLTTRINGYVLQLTFQYRNTTNGGWTLDIADSGGNAIVSGVPLVTGADLLVQYAYLNIGCSLYVATDSDPDAVPTYDNLGSDAKFYVVTNP